MSPNRSHPFTALIRHPVQTHGMDDFKNNFMVGLGDLPKGNRWFEKKQQEMNKVNTAMALIQSLEHS